jgi:uncharacterized repeat protein (TIGR02543 family)
VLGPGGTGFLTGVALPDAAHPFYERIGVALDESYAVMADGTVYAWGYNYYGGLGTGNTNGQPDATGLACTCYTYPIHVVGPDGTGNLGDIVSLGSGGDDTGYAITSATTLYAWGYNGYGQLGNGAVTVNSCSCTTRPSLVLNTAGTAPLAGVFAVSASDNDWVFAVVQGETFTVTVSQEGTGTVAPGTSTYQAGTEATFTATPAAGQVFVGWTLDGIPSSTTSPLKFTVNANRTLKATFAPVASFTVTVSQEGAGTVSPGTGSYPAGTEATFHATADAGQIFLGWTLDGEYVGFPGTLKFTVSANRTLKAVFAATPTFSDVPTTEPDYYAITFLAALGIINPNGVNGSGQFQPDRDVVRAEMASFVARVFAWNKEFHVNYFPDKCDGAGANCVDDELWNNVAALADYGVVGGYSDQATCASVGTTSPCYLPRDPVLRVQVISIITRAFIKTPQHPDAFWDRLPADLAQYTNVPNTGTQRSDLTTYTDHVEVFPDVTDVTTFPNPTGNGTRRFVVAALFEAFHSWYGLDHIP